MEKEIGSEFWMDTSVSAKVSRSSSVNFPNWLTKFNNIVMTSSGRGSISLLLDEVEGTVPKTALLPSYICESIVLPFIHHGYQCSFYGINSDLTPDINSIRNFKNVGVFLHMGYYGFYTNCCVTAVIEQLRQQSTIVVEDITHTLFSDSVCIGQSDYYVASLRKWAGIPSGGFLASFDKQITRIFEYNNRFCDVRKQALNLKYVYMKNGNEELKDQYRALFSAAEKMLDIDLHPYVIDSLSETMVSQLDVMGLKKRRQENFNYLLSGLKGDENIMPIFGHLPYDVCPMFCPVYIKENRDEIQSDLARQKIYCPVHWPVPKLVSISEKVSQIYSKILSLPCDQRYGRNEMNAIVTVLTNKGGKA